MSEAGNAITKVVSSGKGFLSVVDSTGKTVTRSNGSRSWRNNNPGNIIDASAAQGVIGRDSYGDPVFATYEQGAEAQRRLLFVPNSTKQNFASKTLHDAIYKYTPPVVEPATGQLGRPDQYIKTILNAVPGITENTVLSSMTPTQQQQMLKVMQKTEGYIPGTITDGAKTPTDANNSTNSAKGINADDKGSASNANYEEIALDPTPNYLLEYPSYTYNISLHMMTVEEYNNVVRGTDGNNKKYTYSPNNVLIASGGRHNETGGNLFKRNEYFREDFYFSNLKLNTVIGTTYQSRNTNVVDLEFSITEPYGLTLIDRLYDACKTLSGGKSTNYLDQPYILQIDFFASNDAGGTVGIIPGMSKLIPIHLVTMNIKAGIQGATYNVTAVAYHHTAYDISTITTPASFTISANTVQELFTSSAEETYLTKALSDAEVQREVGKLALQKSGTTVEEVFKNNSAQASSLMQSAIDATSTPEQIVSAKSQTAMYNVNSYSSAINEWYTKLADKKSVEYPDKYLFKFDDDIKNSGFIADSAVQTPLVNNKDINAQTNLITSSIDKDNKVDSNSNDRMSFTFPPGTSIEMVIGYVMRRSKWIQSQFKVPEEHPTVEEYFKAKREDENKPLRWYKIVPTVSLVNFDNIRQTWSKVVTYNIIAYEIRNVQTAAAPQGQVKHPIKEYNYMYTGKNVDIIDLDIDFKMLYYVGVSSDRDNMRLLYPNGTPTNMLTAADESTNKTSDNPDNAQPMQRKVELITSGQTAGTVSPKEQAINETEKTLFNTSYADMLTVDLKILGDPAFIKQDDVFYPPIFAKRASKPGLNIDPRLVAEGDKYSSLIMDRGEVYARLNFYTPRDMDESNGMAVFDPKLKSGFSGLYVIKMIISEFTGGQFTQTLQLVRLFRQGIKDTPKVERTDDKALPAETKNPEKIVEAPPTTTATTVDDKAPDNKPDKPAEETKVNEPVTPAASTPPPTPPVDANKEQKQALNDKIRELENSIYRLSDSSSTHSVTSLNNSAHRFDHEIAKYKQSIIDARTNFGPDAPIIKDFEKSIASEEAAQAKSAAEAVEAQKELDSNKAELATLKSQLAAL